MGIKDQLQSLITTVSEGNVSKFARRAGIVPNTVHNYLKGRPPNSDFLVEIQKTYRVNLNWLLTGEGEMFLNGRAPPVVSDGIYRGPPAASDDNSKDDLTRIITIVETWVKETGMEISPAHKARLISMLMAEPQK